LRAAEASRLAALESATDITAFEKSRVISESHALLGEIDAALGRLDDGSYGVCHGCGRMIAVARLEAVPYTRHCELCS